MRHPTDIRMVSLLALLLAGLIGMSVMGYTLPALLFCCFGLGVNAILIAIAWTGKCYRQGRSQDSATMTSVVFIALMIVTIWSQWPFKLSFLLSRPALNDLAAQVRANDFSALPAKIGLLAIHKGYVEGDGVVYLLTNSDQEDYRGFVLCPPLTQPRNPFYVLHLDNEWRYYEED